jgi:hypothetical protein
LTATPAESPKTWDFREVAGGGGYFFQLWISVS